MLHKGLALVLTCKGMSAGYKTRDKAEAICDGAGEPNKGTA
jgi:hypothetical protein